MKVLVAVNHPVRDDDFCFVPDGELCGEKADDEMAEIWNPARPDLDSVLAHASCFPEGWEIA